MKKLHYITDTVSPVPGYDYPPIKWVWRWKMNGVEIWRMSTACRELLMKCYYLN